MPDPSQQQSPGASPPASGLHSPQQPNNMLPRGPGRNVVPSGHQSQSGSGRPSGPPPQRQRPSGPAPPPPRGPPPQGAQSGRSRAPESARMTSKLAVLKQAGRLAQKKQMRAAPQRPGKPLASENNHASTHGLSVQRATEILRRPTYEGSSRSRESDNASIPAFIRPEGQQSPIDRVRKQFQPRTPSRRRQPSYNGLETKDNVEEVDDECDSVTSEPPVTEIEQEKGLPILELAKESVFMETYINKGRMEIEFLETKNLARVKEMNQIKEQVKTVPESEKDEAITARIDKLKEIKTLVIKMWIEAPGETEAMSPVSIKIQGVNRNGNLPGPEVHKAKLELTSFDENSKISGPIILRYQILEGERTVLGSGAMDIRRGFKAIRSPATIRLPIVDNYNKSSPLLTDTLDATNGLLCGTIRFLPAQMGILVVTCLEGLHLPNKEMIGQQDPYIRVTLGKQTKRSTTIENGGSNPIFDRDELELRIDETNWTKDVSVNLWDEDIGRDDHIGQVSFSALAFMQSLKDQVVLFDLKGKDGQPAGQVRLQLKYYPAGTLKVTCVAGRNLADVEAMGYQDPYCMITIQQHYKSYCVSTEVDWSAGTNPQWDQTFTFQIVDAVSLKMEVYDHERIGPDKLIGSVSLPLLPVYRKGIKDGWIPVKTRSNWGKLEDRGEIFIEVDFVGPAGVAFPQRRMEGEAFDETERRYRGGKKPKTLTLDGEPGEGVSGPQYDMTFTDKEIEDAFNFIDLDNNLRVGPKEVRHILTCMGQLITAEEIDMMIDMMDADGDGSISFKEFYSIVRHPEPAYANFKKKGNLIDPFEVNKKPDVSPFKSRKRLLPKAAPPGLIEKQQTHKDQRKTQKVEYLRKFADERNLVGTVVKDAYERFVLSPVANKQLDYTDFLRVFELRDEPLHKNLFQSFQTVSPNQKVDLREICLCLLVICERDHDSVTDAFCDMFDPNNERKITVEHIEQLLKATHFAETIKDVRRKAATVMRTCGGAEVTPAALKSASRRFPALLFPPLPSGNKEPSSFA